MKKEWVKVPWYDECLNCGSDNIEALTDCQKEGLLNDGDKIRCNSCGEKGIFCVSEEPYGGIDWPDA